nr:hypothetical protein [Tanacetum cinerariifolium]
MEPRSTRVQEAIPMSQEASSRVRRKKERVVEIEDAPKREGSRVERNDKGEDYTGCITPFVNWIEDYPLPDGLKNPSHIGSYDGKGDPDNFLHLFKGAIHMQKWEMIYITSRKRKEKALELSLLEVNFYILKNGVANINVTSGTDVDSIMAGHENLHDENAGKSVNFYALITPAENEIDVSILVESIRAINERFVNTEYGFILEKKVIPFPFISMDSLDLMLENEPWFIRNNPLILKKWNPNVNLLKEDVVNVLVWVKLHGVSVTAFSEDGLSSIATKLDNIMVAIPKLVEEEFYTCTIHVKYEWKPPKCAYCKVFGHVQDECPKNIGLDVVKNLKKPSQAPRGVSVGPKKNTFSANTSYPKTLILRIGQYSVSKKSDMAYWSIRRDLDNSKSNVRIPLDSWTSELLVYKESLSSKWVKSLRVKDEVPPMSKNDMPLRAYSTLSSIRRIQLTEHGVLSYLTVFFLAILLQVNMDDPNITLEEYIRLEEEKACRRGKVYNWKTATYGKIWDNEDVHDLGTVESEFPATVFNDTLTSEAPLSYEPMVSSLNDEIDFRISFDDSDDED